MNCLATEKCPGKTIIEIVMSCKIYGKAPVRKETWLLAKSKCSKCGEKMFMDEKNLNRIKGLLRQ